MTWEKIKLAWERTHKAILIAVTIITMIITQIGNIIYDEVNQPTDNLNPAVLLEEVHPDCE